MHMRQLAFVVASPVIIMVMLVAIVVGLIGCLLISIADRAMDDAQQFAQQFKAWAEHVESDISNSEEAEAVK